MADRTELKLARALERIEIRDPRAATLGPKWVPVGQAQVANWDAEQAVRLAYLSNVYVYRCVEVIANAIAGCPIRVGKDKKSKPNVKAPLAVLLGPPPGGPMPRTTARRLIAWTVAQRLVTGRWSWEIERVTSRRKGNTVTGLWPIPANKISPIPTKGGREWFSGFKFLEWSGQERELGIDEVIYDWNPSQLDFRQPESVIQAAGLDISVAVMQDRYDVAFLKNDARPAAVVVHEQFAEKSERNAFRQQFLSEFRGVDNAGKPIFVEAGDGDGSVADTFHIERLGISQKDAESIARYASKIRAICVAFGTPMSILGDSSARTFSNAGHEYTNWWEGTNLPLMQELEDAINLQLAPLLGDEICWFDTGHVRALTVPGKLVSMGPQLPTLIADGTIKRNEVRDELDLEPLTDEELAEIEEKEAAAVAAPPNPEKPEDPDPVPTPTAPAKGQNDKQANAVQRTQEWRAYDQTAKVMGRTFERAFATMFERQGAEATRRLAGRSRRHAAHLKTRQETDGAERAVSDGVQARELADAIAPVDTLATDVKSTAGLVFEQITAQAGTAVARGLDISYDMNADWVATHVIERSEKLADLLAARTNETVRTVLLEGMDAGEELEDLGRRVVTAFRTMADVEAPLIARAEVGPAYNGAQRAYVDALPSDLVDGLEWVSSRDSRTRPSHAAADGQIIRRGERFLIGDQMVRHPADPEAGPAEAILCRCTVRPVKADTERVVSVERAMELMSRVAMQEVGYARAIEMLAPQPR